MWKIFIFYFGNRMVEIKWEITNSATTRAFELWPSYLQEQLRNFTPWVNLLTYIYRRKKWQFYV